MAAPVGSLRRVTGPPVMTSIVGERLGVLAYGEPGKVIRLFLLAREIDMDPVLITTVGLQRFDIHDTWRFRQIPPVRRH